MTRSTETLIATLSQEAGRRSGLPMRAFPRALFLVAGLSLTAAVAVVLLLGKVRPDLSAAVTGAAFLFKIAGTGSLALAGAWLVLKAAAPGRGEPRLSLLLPGLLLMALRAATDRSGLSYLGVHRDSSLSCVVVIVAAALPGLSALVLLLRQGAPTHPVLACALAGTLAGALGASAYTLACVNDAGSFVLLWYGAAVALVTAGGAALGRLALRW